MAQTLLVIMAETDEENKQFHVYHWLADSEALTPEMSEWLAEVCTTDYECLSPEPRGFVAGGFWDDGEDFEDVEDEDFRRGRELGKLVWKHKTEGRWGSQYVTHGNNIDTVYTAMFYFC